MLEIWAPYIRGAALLHPTRMKTVALGGLGVTGPVPGHTLLPSFDLPTFGAVCCSAHDQ